MTTSSAPLFPVLQFTGTPEVSSPIRIPADMHATSSSSASDISPAILGDELHHDDQPPDVINELHNDSQTPDTTSACSNAPLVISAHAPDKKRSTRLSRPPIWHQDYITKSSGSDVCLLVSNHVGYQCLSPTYSTALSSYSAISEPHSFQEVALDPKWVDAMKSEIAALEENNT
ncbi:uncharacterized protein LOC132068606 isoform X3 [Lycium ferocissimum]|uniref:uncharacterized protein LOC132068606 isoform X3 n=1 Tax=Lycium ferocissimum TaxID=112874 RepID=UPI002815C615|nr:uncharacterized protein LOC132068606 isoform X3 [Lycium ferocissimum]